MVNFALSVVAVLSVLAPIVKAAPAATQVGDAVEVFSFVKWVDGIIANPNGDNLTPEEAVQAWRKSINATQSVVASTVDSHLQKRVSCNTIAGTEAYVPDAVTCINYLASLGGQACVVSEARSIFCTAGNAQISGVRGISIPVSSSCNDVARGAGYVMDACTRADNLVQGSEFAYGNGNLLVWIRAPYP
ncbi:hypothetical protein EsH8_XV_000033 [Colletotrichum jinshuiense]